jgi:hypothetical protein
MLTERDQEFALEFVQVQEQVNLRKASDGEDTCTGCHYFTDPTSGVSYCWHNELGIVVGGDWICDEYAERGTIDAEMTDTQRAIADKKQHRLVDANRWVNEPVDGEECAGCLYYKDLNQDISYCWNPNLQVEVGHDHHCKYWEQPIGN